MKEKDREDERYGNETCAWTERITDCHSSHYLAPGPELPSGGISIGQQKRGEARTGKKQYL